MIHELRIYTIKPTRVSEYVDHFQLIGLPIIRRYLSLVGFWTVEFGDINDIYSLWDFSDLTQRTHLRAGLSGDHEWRSEFLPKALELIVAQRTVFLKPGSFSSRSGLAEPPENLPVETRY